MTGQTHLMVQEGRDSKAELDCGFLSHGLLSGAITNPNSSNDKKYMFGLDLANNGTMVSSMCG